MWGKHYASMYTGSMRGKGSPFFAVWGYVISHFVPDRECGAWVELNAEIIAFLIGEREDVVRGVIDEMCQPDPKSRSQELDGRKLVSLGGFAYKVVNGAEYKAIRDEEDRREQNRINQKRHREKIRKLESPDKKPRAKTPRQIRAEAQSRERRYVEAMNDGDPASAERIASEDLPAHPRPTLPQDPS